MSISQSIHKWYIEQTNTMHKIQAYRKYMELIRNVRWGLIEEICNLFMDYRSDLMVIYLKLNKGYVNSVISENYPVDQS
jgi:hypothetical protein